MDPVIVRAPGKLVLVGEYAVLDGGGAMVAAVNRGVSCTVEPVRVAGEVEPGAVEPAVAVSPAAAAVGQAAAAAVGQAAAVAVSPAAAAALAAAVEPGAAVRIVTPGDDRFVRAALAGAPPGRYTFADWNPVDLGGAKPGFGGSAAATVAAVVAAGLPAARAYEAHHAVQGGGSGVDVFASLLGGVRRFPDGASVALRCEIVAVWSGASASTGPRVARYRAWAGRAAFVDASRALVDAFAADPIRVARDAYALLRDMATDAGLDYDTPAHTRIATLAADFGGAAKPSGAGGGDVAVAFLPDRETRARFSAAVAAEGLLPIDVAVAPGAWPGPHADALPPR